MSRGKRFDVRERARPEVAVVPAADREHGDVERVQAVDERPVAPERVERGMGAVRRELRVHVDHTAAREIGDVRPVVDLAALGRLDATREDDVVVERRRRLHRRDRDQVRGPLDGGAVARLAAEALAEHADTAIREGLRREPFDEVVRVAAGLPEAAVVPAAAGATDAAQGRDDRVVATRGEEVGFIAVEVAQHDVGRELDDDSREPTLDRYTVARGRRSSHAIVIPSRTGTSIVVPTTSYSAGRAYDHHSRVAVFTDAFCITATAPDCYRPMSERSAAATSSIASARTRKPFRCADIAVFSQANTNVAWFL